MTEALDQNRADVLSANFIGTAGDKLTATIQEQAKSGLHQHIIDRGHSVEAVFYSPEGSAIELHDTAHLQIDVMDGRQGGAHRERDGTLCCVAYGCGELVEGAGSGGGAGVLESTDESAEAD